MTKSFKQFRIQFGSKPNPNKDSSAGKPLYKHSMYMQSRDSTWIHRNTKEEDDVSSEPGIREDLPE